MARRLGNESKEENGSETFWNSASASSRKRPRKERQEFYRERLGAEAHRSQVSWTTRTDGCHGGVNYPKHNVGIKGWQDLTGAP